MRHGQREPWNPGQVQSEKSKGVMRGALAGRQLGCYFCNDVVAPGDVSIAIFFCKGRGGLNIVTFFTWNFSNFFLYLSVYFCCPFSRPKIGPLINNVPSRDPAFLWSPPDWLSNWWSLFSNILKGSFSLCISTPNISLPICPPARQKAIWVIISVVFSFWFRQGKRFSWDFNRCYDNSPTTATTRDGQ